MAVTLTALLNPRGLDAPGGFQGKNKKIILRKKTLKNEQKNYAYKTERVN